MRAHRNAKTTPKGRAVLVKRVLQEGWSVRQAARGSGVSKRTCTNGWLAIAPEASRRSQTGRLHLVDVPVALAGDACRVSPCFAPDPGARRYRIDLGAPAVCVARWSGGTFSRVRGATCSPRGRPAIRRQTVH